MITCEKCQLPKDDDEFPFQVDEYGKQLSERTIWCRSCIGQEKVNRGTPVSPNAAAAIPGTRRDGYLTDQQIYYREHREEKLEYQRRRYWRQKGFLNPPRGTRHYKHKELPPIPGVSETTEQEQARLTKKADQAYRWILVCFRDWELQETEENKIVAAGGYKSAVNSLQRIRDELGLPFLPLTGDPAKDAAELHRE